MDGNGSVGVAPEFRVSLISDTNGIETVGIFGNSLMWLGNPLKTVVTAVAAAAAPLGWSPSGSGIANGECI